MKNIIINKIKDEINKLFDTKINILYSIIDNLKINIEIILDNIETKPLPDDMRIIYELIVNYTDVVNNQNNRFLFKVSDASFNIIYDFIHNNLEPPLIFIKEQYNSIEEKLLNELIRIIEEFPDFYEVLRDKLKLDLIHENISLFYDDIEDLFSNYTNILDREYDSYINKLIHFTFINGLFTYDKPCTQSFCLIDLENGNEQRILEEIENKNIHKIKLNKIKFDKNKINRLKNKKIRKLDGYDHTMGSINENDLDNFLLDLKDILINFNKSYLGIEFKNINKNAISFFNKINGTYIQKLHKSIHMTALKFSTILTKDNYNQLELNIYKQYNDIVDYIHNNSNIIENNKDNFINLLNSTSNFIESLFNLCYNKIKQYYEIFQTLIQNKMKQISKQELEEYNSRKLETREKIKDYKEVDDPNSPDFKNKDLDKAYYEKKFTNSKDEPIILFKDVQLNLKVIMKGEFESIFKKEKKDENANNNNKKDKDKFELGAGVALSKKEMKMHIGKCITLLGAKFSFMIVFGPLGPFYLGASFIVSVEASICLELGFDLNWDKKEYCFYIDINGKIVPSLTLDFGVYFPSPFDPLRCSLNLGIHGILTSITAGVKLSLFMGNKNQNFEIDHYYIYKAYEFSFYVLFRIEAEINLGIFKFKFSFQFYIYQALLGGLKYEKHVKRTYKYSNAKEIKDLYKTEKGKVKKDNKGIANIFK